MPARTVKGTSLFYEESGSGAPLVLLHGFPLDSRVWEAQRAALSDKWRVVTPDLRGFGKSGSSDAFSIESLAEDVQALLGEIGARPCALGGLSMGGYVALAFAKKYPGDLKALILVDTRAEGDTPEGKAGREKMIEVARTQGSKAIADQMMPKMLAPDGEKNRPAVGGRLREIMEACPAKTIERALAAMRDRPDRTGDLASISVPTLIVVGEADAITPVSAAEAMQRGIPKSELAVIKGAGHMAPMEQPEQVGKVIRDFLKHET